MKPAMFAVEVQHKTVLLQASVTNVTSDVNIRAGGVSTNDNSGQGARVKETNVWDEEW